MDLPSDPAMTEGNTHLLSREVCVIWAGWEWDTEPATLSISNPSVVTAVKSGDRSQLCAVGHVSISVYTVH